MKNKRDLIIFIGAFCLVFLLGIFVTVIGRQEKYPSFSSYGTGANGSKAAYLLLEDLGFNVSRFYDSARKMNSGDVIILIEPNYVELAMTQELKLINDFIYEGNTIILVGDYLGYFSASFLLQENQEMEELKNIQLEDNENNYYDISYGAGCFRIIPNSSLFLNKFLRKEGTATQLVSTLWDFIDMPIVFNEYGRQAFVGEDYVNQIKPSALMLISIPWRIVIAQILLGFLLIALQMGKSMGPRKTFSDVIEREQNEDVLAFGRLMERSNLSMEAFKLYYGQFKEEAKVFLRMGIVDDENNIMQLWRGKGLGYCQELDNVLQHIKTDKNDSRIDNKSLLDLFNNIDILREEMKKQ